MMTVHSFRQSLDQYHEDSNENWIDLLYAKYFGEDITTKIIKQDGWAQRGGVDRVIVLPSGKVITVDEKIRTDDWPDFAIEIWSDKGRQVPGWIKKDLACDYIVYIFKPSRSFYVFPFLLLQRTWYMYESEWMEYAEVRVNRFRFVQANNVGYITESVAVPRNILLQAMADSMLARLSSPEVRPSSCAASAVRDGGQYSLPMTDA